MDVFNDCFKVGQIVINLGQIVINSIHLYIPINNLNKIFIVICHSRHHFECNLVLIELTIMSIFHA
jgi:hypothetical protein